MNWSKGVCYSIILLLPKSLGVAGKAPKRFGGDS